MLWLGGLGLGIVIGIAYYKWMSGIGDVQAEAFVNGYTQGHDDGQRGREPRFEIWDGSKWRREQAATGENAQ